MSQSNIFIDIGNSAIKWRIPYSEVYSENLDNFLSNKLPQADKAWVSVVAYDHIIEDLKAHFNEVHIVKAQKQFSKLKIAYDDSSSLGSDRFCAMLGSMDHFPGKPLLVIDIGSAMTFDVLDENGLHLGGLIMPGLNALRKSFSNFETSDLTANDIGLAVNTENAWKNGTQDMLLSAINNQIQKFNDNFSDGIVTTSGGLVNDIKNYLPKSVQIFDNLVIDGLESYSQTVG
ncbi:type III pantothenate kinase [Candidatus Thioglobus sp.]|nr:type III pantothenate kinase [Candidatus Thioglobus sp.]